AQVALQQDNRGLAIDLIHRYLPQPGLEDLRGLEWRYLWQESRGDELQTFAHPHIVNTAVLTPDGQRVITSALDGKVRVWEVASGKVTQQFDGGGSPNEPTATLAVSPNGELLVFQDHDGLQVRETTGWTLVQRLDSAGEPIAFTPEGRSLISASTHQNALL